MAEIIKKSPTKAVVDDILEGFLAYEFAFRLAFLLLKNQYRGSMLGPFWITLSSAFFFIGLGIVYSILWKVDVLDFLPWLLTGFSTWIVISTTLTSSCSVFISSEQLMKRKKLPISVYVLRNVFTSCLFFLHQFPLMLVAIPISGSFNITTLAWLPFSFTVFVINTFFISVVLGFACARFRDLQQIVVTLLQLAFFLTPIIWVPDMLGQFEHWMYLNPLTSFVELIRAPILGEQISMKALLVSLSCTMLNGLCFFLLLAKYKNRVIFWV